MGGKGCEICLLNVPIKSVVIIIWEINHWYEWLFHPVNSLVVTRIWLLILISKIELFWNLNKQGFKKF
jgi:hypothetical protein